jgi:hypothetical protein
MPKDECCEEAQTTEFCVPRRLLLRTVVDVFTSYRETLLRKSRITVMRALKVVAEALTIIVSLDGGPAKGLLAVCGDPA